MLARLATAAALAAAALALPAGAQAADALVVGPARVHSGPGPRFPVTRVAEPGRMVHVDYCSGDRRWCQISRPHWSGWVQARYLDTRPPHRYHPARY